MKRLIGIIIASVLTMLCAFAIAEDAIPYPAEADTVEEQKGYLGEVEEKLRQWHNEQVAGMTAAQAEAWRKEHFYWRVKKLQGEINTITDFYRDPDTGEQIKNTPALPKTPIWNANIDVLSKVEVESVGSKIIKK